MSTSIDKDMQSRHGIMCTSKKLMRVLWTFASAPPLLLSDYTMEDALVDAEPEAKGSEVTDDGLRN
jgi:hypothetical protein